MALVVPAKERGEGRSSFDLLTTSDSGRSHKGVVPKECIGTSLRDGAVEE
ncbi:MAG: hypothetical protein ACK5Q5_23895 [Planctomycetaceae bacterium]